MNRTAVAEDVIGAYRKWHAKNPTRAQKIRYDFPETIPLLGKALRIVYWSDKWEANGKGYHYEHDFDSAPPCYGALTDRSSARSGRDTARLLNQDSVDCAMQFPILAEVCELSVDVKGEGIKTFSFRKPPMMLCTTDMRSLVVLYDVPIIVRGGRMRVTERGIVN